MQQWVTAICSMPSTCPSGLLQVHNLSGPFRVEDGKGQPAMPGDLLVVEILDLGPLEGHEWGFTGIFDRENGGGFLTDHFPEACKAIWDFEGIYCSSRHVPGASLCKLLTVWLSATSGSYLADIHHRCTAHFQQPLALTLA